MAPKRTKNGAPTVAKRPSPVPEESTPVHAADLEALERVMMTLSHDLLTLLTKFPWLKKLDLNQISKNHPDRLVRELSQRPQLQFASALVREHAAGHLPVLDDIVESSASALTVPPHASCISLQELDRQHAGILRTANERLQVMKARYTRDHTGFTLSWEETRKLKDLAAGFRSTDTDWPPPLPTIDDPMLRRRVFMHRSLADSSATASAPDIQQSHNERLEFIGDAQLNFFVSMFLYNRFPNADEGFLSVSKSDLVCNKTLFDFSVIYKLHEQLHVSDDLRSKIFGDRKDGLPNMDARNKAIADVFESYAGGVSIDKGVTVLQDWLARLFAPLIAELKDAPTINRDSKNELYRQIGSHEQPIEYILMSENGPPFTVRCCVGGTVLGTGTGQNQRLAGQRAAAEALQKHDLIGKLAARRRELVRNSGS